MSGAGSSALYWHGWSAGQYAFGSANGPNDRSPESDDIPGCLEIIAEARTSNYDGVRWLAKEGMTCRLNRGFYGQAGARSQHQDGVFVAFVDGSVHFIANHIETSVSCCSAWDKLILSSDGEIQDASQGIY